MGMKYESKVIDVTAGAVSSLLMGEGGIDTDVLPAYINTMAGDGWCMVFMEKVMRRHRPGSDRERLMITFKRRVPEAEGNTNQRVLQVYTG
jgi:hypothetical protein